MIIQWTDVFIGVSEGFKVSGSQVMAGPTVGTTGSWQKAVAASCKWECGEKDKIMNPCHWNLGDWLLTTKQRLGLRQTENTAFKTVLFLVVTLQSFNRQTLAETQFTQLSNLELKECRIMSHLNLIIFKSSAYQCFLGHSHTYNQVIRFRKLHSCLPSRGSRATLPWSV